MRVKICGLQNYADADLALSLGATELGFIFTTSPRRMDVMDAKLICRNLPTQTVTIGVFKDDPLESILRVVEEVNLKGVQLHGQETPDFVRKLQSAKPGLRLFKTIGVHEGEFSLDPEQYPTVQILFDSQSSHSTPHLRSPIDSKRLAEFPGSFYLAGGLTASNVTELIQRYKPIGIDVSSGVEVSPGIKDHKLMQKLFSRLKGSL